MRLDDTRHLLLAGALVGGVLGTLTLAAVLQTDDETSRSAVVAAPVATPVPPLALPGGPLPPLPAEAAEPAERAATEDPTAATRRPDPAPSGPPARPAEPAEPRNPRGRTVSPPSSAPAPPAKTARSAGDWTLQFMVTCRAELVERLDRTLGGDDRLLIAPVTVKDRPCHRICWGRYPSREIARQAPDIPAALASLQQSPLPRPVAEVTP